MLKITLVFAGIILFTSCTNKDQLAGTWERIGAYDPGMQIKVEEYSNKMIGEIVKAAPNDSTFKVGEVKWKNIVQLSKDRYECGDLQKWEWELGSIYKNGYDDATLILKGDTLKLRLFSKDQKSKGDEQTWIKIKE